MRISDDGAGVNSVFDILWGHRVTYKKYVPCAIHHTRDVLSQAHHLVHHLDGEHGLHIRNSHVMDSEGSEDREHALNHQSAFHHNGIAGDDAPFLILDLTHVVIFEDVQVLELETKAAGCVRDESRGIPVSEALVASRVKNVADIPIRMRQTNMGVNATGLDSVLHALEREEQTLLHGAASSLLGDVTAMNSSMGAGVSALGVEILERLLELGVRHALEEAGVTLLDRHVSLLEICSHRLFL